MFFDSKVALLKLSVCRLAAAAEFVSHCLIDESKVRWQWFFHLILVLSFLSLRSMVFYLCVVIYGRSVPRQYRVLPGANNRSQIERKVSVNNCFAKLLFFLFSSNST